MEWIKQNEALLIEELETRRQAGLPIQVIVEVEKITPSMPEYCQIIPDFCHLDVIKEETSASDEDRNRENWKCSEKNQKVINFDNRSDKWNCVNVNKEIISEMDVHSEISLNDTDTSDCNLERLESPYLVRESENLRFADIINTENECVTELETPELLKNVLKDVNNLGKNNEYIEPEIWDVSNNNINCKQNMNERIFENIDHYKNQIQHKHIENQTFSNNNVSDCNNSSYKDVNNQDNYIEIFPKDKRVYHLEVTNTNFQFNDCFTSTESKFNTQIKTQGVYSTHEHDVKKIEISQSENKEYEDSSDDSTVKQCRALNYRYKTRAQHKVSVHDKLKQIARLLQDDTTDDYEELQSSQTNSRCVSLASDADVDTDWVSFTLSDGESSKSLCLSPSQLKSSFAPSTVTETSEIIDLHKKFLDRTKSPNILPYGGTTPVEILSYSESPMTSPSKSYTTDVIDEACRMCGTSDEPLSDAECLVSLRKYRETRSRLLDVIQKEQQLNHRSVVDRPSPMPMYIDTLSVPDNHTRELMYTEYMEKVKERENRLHNKVIRITKASRPLSSGTLQALNDIDAEFLSKARERLEKLGVDPDVNIELKDNRYYPKHLVDIVPEDEVCVEEVQMFNGESSELSVRVCVCVYVLVLFYFTNTVFAV